MKESEAKHLVKLGAEFQNQIDDLSEQVEEIKVALRQYAVENGLECGGLLVNGDVAANFVKAVSKGLSALGVREVVKVKELFGPSVVVEEIKYKLSDEGKERMEELGDYVKVDEVVRVGFKQVAGVKKPKKQVKVVFPQ
jgi:hypothetical protein